MPHLGQYGGPIKVTSERHDGQREAGSGDLVGLKQRGHREGNTKSMRFRTRRPTFPLNRSKGDDSWSTIFSKVFGANGSDYDCIVRSD